MSLRQLIGGSAAALIGAATLLASVATTQAVTLSVTHYRTPPVRQVDCAVGAHIGPVGGCIVGNDNRPPVVVEHRLMNAPDPQAADGCSTKSITRTDSNGDSVARTKTNC